MSKLVKGIYIKPFLLLLLNIVALPGLLLVLSRANENSALQNSLYLILAINILFLAALIHDSVSLKRRVRALKENAESLVKAQPIYNQVDGDDELAQLDLSIHEISEQHEEALSFRHSVSKLMAHDLKSPLSSSLLALDLLSETEKDLSESGRSRVKQVKNNLERQLSLLNNFLLIEQLEGGRLELSLTPENLAELISKSLDGLAPSALAKGISFEFEKQNAYANLDRDKILLVIGSYLSNAIKFSPTGGKVAVRLVKEADMLRVEVQDHGIGVGQEESVKLFQKFAKSAVGRKTGGAGLSLAIGKEIIEAHGGKVGVESKLEQGSTFWFSVPSANQNSDVEDDL